jgi:hypothetical protein
LRSRQRGQSVVEFGIIAITFTLIMFAIADFGLLLNDWLSVSSGARLLARDAAVGMFQADLTQEATTLKIPGVSADPHFGGSYCCNSSSALVLKVVYYDQCTPGVSGCDDSRRVSIGSLDSRYYQDGTQGTCTSWLAIPSIACLHPSAPKAGTCNGNQPCPGDSVVVTLTAAGAQVITPLVRPFFSRPNMCPDNSSPSRCYVALSSTVTMRFEGDIL